MKKQKSVLAWHFLPDDGLTSYKPRQKVEVGKPLTFDGKPLLCRQGYHASRRAIDALQYAPGALVCRVRLSGTIVEGDDKLVATERTVLWMADATRVLHLFACDEAERALNERLAKYGEKPDPRSLAAIATKRKWVDGKATDKELGVARAAAWWAAAAYAADAAAAAAAAARDAYDAYDAACAADDASAAQNKRLEKALMALRKESK